MTEIPSRKELGDVVHYKEHKGRICMIVKTIGYNSLSLCTQQTSPLNTGISLKKTKHRIYCLYSQTHI